jgi:hypothetical protein
LGVLTYLDAVRAAMQHWLVLAVVAVCCLSIADSRFIIEKSGLKLRFPPDAASRSPYSAGFDMSLANFGAPEYGGELVGKLVYVDKDYGHSYTCEPECKYACAAFSDAKPSPLKLNPPSDGQNYIMMVDRGPINDEFHEPCKFAEKVWNSQLAGAQAVIVVNYEDRHTTMEAPDDNDEVAYKYLRNITIPAVFITKSDGDALKTLLKVDSSGSTKDVVVVMDWKDALPAAEKVKWEFWSNSNDMCGPVCDVQKEFIKEFQDTARELEGNWTVFEPHYIVWVCPDVYRSSQECQSQCIHNGRYCTPDPDGDLMDGYSGADIVQENLRQLCVFHLANASGEPWRWWQYVTKFADECKMSDNKYTEACAEQVFNELNTDNWSTVDELRSCIGDINADTRNDRMEAEMESQWGNQDVGEVYILPTIRINDGQYRGKIAYEPVLKAICAAFSGQKPEVCSKLTSSNCRPGSEGDRACRARSDGKTMCKDTLSSYECVCGAGFQPHTNEDGSETCISVNKCMSPEVQNNPDCTCERCACQALPGDYRCIQNLPDECAVDNGGCWQGDFKVNGQMKHFSACSDNIRAYRAAAASGRDVSNVSLSTCKCPPCFYDLTEGDKVQCVAKGNLDLCDLQSGVYSAEAGTGGPGTPLWAVLAITVGCLGLVAAAGYAAYRLRLRNAMHQEIRSIMAQYMPLGEEADAEEKQGLRNGTATP